MKVFLKTVVTTAQLCADTKTHREFPAGPVVGLCALTAEGAGLIPAGGTKVLQAWPRTKQNPTH